MKLPERYSSVRNRTEEICSPLSVEDHGMQPVVDVSPPKWHLAHTTWFFETFVLKPHLKGYPLFNQKFPFYFNSYYQTMGERQRRDRRGWLTRPSVEQVYEYRSHVDRHMRDLLGRKKLSAEISGLIEIGLHHEQQHQELLLTDIKYGLAVQPFHPVYSDQPLIPDGRIRGTKSKWISVKGGLYEIGHHGKGFAFDNEYARHEVKLEDYSIMSAPVTNGEYMRFIEDGGYEDFRHWHDEGWAWVQNENRGLPLYWEQKKGQYYHFTLSGLRKVNANAVLQHVNFYEASAFAAWKGCRLPTEAEWEVASSRFKWGQVWEWTNSAYLPYPGYQKPKGAVGEYNGKFMVNQMVLRGSSIATSPGHARSTYRNFFHSHLQWQYSGLRLARNTSNTNK